jgi:type I restriction enzyme, S subunit
VSGRAATKNKIPGSYALSVGMTEMPAPIGWLWTPMANVAQLESGHTPSRRHPEYWGGNIPWIGIKDARENHGRIITETLQQVTQLGLENSAARLLPEGTVCLSRTASIGYTLTMGVPMATSQDFVNWICSEALCPDFLMQLFIAENESLLRFGKGTTHKTIYFPEVKAFHVCIPPIAEQRRISLKIKSLQEGSSRARRAISEVRPLLAQFRKGVLRAAFSGRLTADWRTSHQNVEPAKTFMERKPGDIKTRRGVPKDVPYRRDFGNPKFPKSWLFASIGDLLHRGVLIDVKDGNHGANHPKSVDFSDEGLPFITAAQVRDYRIDYDNAPKVSGRTLDALRVGFTEIDDVVLTHKGTVGRTALNTAECVLTPQTTYYRCRREYLLPKYLMYYLSSPIFWEQLSGVMSQTTRNFVPIKEQYKLFVLVPPPAEQTAIAELVDTAMQRVNELETTIKVANAALTQIDQSILAKAFRGELVPNEVETARREGGEPEPISALIERIKPKFEAELRRRQSESKRRTRVAARSAEVTSARRALVEVLQQSGKRLSPEQLFGDAGFDDSCIDEFYAELRTDVNSGRIVERRPNKTEVFLEARES